MSGEGRRRTWGAACAEESFRGMKSSLWARKVQCPEMMERAKTSATLGSLKPDKKAVLRLGLLFHAVRAVQAPVLSVQQGPVRIKQGCQRLSLRHATHSFLQMFSEVLRIQCWAKLSPVALEGPLVISSCTPQMSKHAGWGYSVCLCVYACACVSMHVETRGHL